jgi:hypothetical protein
MRRTLACLLAVLCLTVSVAAGAGARHTLAASAHGYLGICHVPDHGFGSYSHWKRLPAAEMLFPRGIDRRDDGAYDVVIHFHRREAVRRSFVEAAHGVVLVGIDLGPSAKSYGRAFRRPHAFPDLLANITRALARYSHNPKAHIRHLALSSFSAGYGAVREILALYGGAIEAVVLLDSLHSDYVPRKLLGADATNRQVWGAPIASVIEYARRAARGEVTLFVSHSQVVPPSYASTSEVADYLIDEVGGPAPNEGIETDAFDMRQSETADHDDGVVSAFDRAGMHVRGYVGSDGAAHCAQVRIFAEALRDYLEPSWTASSSESPSGARASTIVVRDVFIH